MGFEVAHELIFVLQANLMDFSLPVLIRNCAPYVGASVQQCYQHTHCHCCIKHYKRFGL